MIEVGVRALKNQLSHFLKRVKAGERIVITERGIPIAELYPAGTVPDLASMSKLDWLVARGLVRPRLRDGDPLREWPDIRLPPGTAQQLIDEDRDDSPERY
jgi:prevent-host-death family protein